MNSVNTDTHTRTFYKNKIKTLPQTLHYIFTKHKQIKITSFKNPAVEPLPGYATAVPMVFCGMFPTDADQYDLLRESLDKLKLNDASLSYTPESNTAMGFGFRVGFLGLLHLDIVQVCFVLF
jgi:translation elongation factor EF-4